MKAKYVAAGLAVALILASKPALDWYGRGQDTRAVAIIQQALSDASQKPGKAPADLAAAFDAETVKRLKRLGVDASQIRYTPLADDSAPLFTIQRHDRAVEVYKSGAVSIDGRANSNRSSRTRA